MKKILTVANFILLLYSCGNEQNKIQQHIEKVTKDTVTLNEEQSKNAGIETGQLNSRQISTLLKVSGKIDVPPQSMISVGLAIGGYLKSTKLLAGMSVKKGEVLAVMEDAQYIQLQQDYLTAKAQFSMTENEYLRQKELNQSKATSDKIFEQVKANYQTQNVLVKSLEQKLLLIGLNPDKIMAGNISKSIKIYSPITGFVSAVNVNIGKYVSPGEVLFELIDPSDIHLSLSVFEKDVNKLSVGQKLFAYTNTNPDKKYICEIILISKNLSEQSSAQVHCHFEQYDQVLLPGMFMNAEIELKSTHVKALPDEAIVRFQNKQYVFTTSNNKQFTMLEIQTGSSESGWTEILSADKLTRKKFVTKGAYNLLMALKNSSEE